MTSKEQRVVLVHFIVFPSLDPLSQSLVSLKTDCRAATMGSPVLLEYKACLRESSLVISLVVGSLKDPVIEWKKEYI